MFFFLKYVRLWIWCNWVQNSLGRPDELHFGYTDFSRDRCTDMAGPGDFFRRLFLRTFDLGILQYFWHAVNFQFVSPTMTHQRQPRICLEKVRKHSRMWPIIALPYHKYCIPTCAGGWSDPKSIGIGVRLVGRASHRLAIFIIDAKNMNWCNGMHHSLKSISQSFFGLSAWLSYTHALGLCHAVPAQLGRIPRFCLPWKWWMRWNNVSKRREEEEEEKLRSALNAREREKKKKMELRIHVIHAVIPQTCCTSWASRAAKLANSSLSSHLSSSPRFVLATRAMLTWRTLC